MPEEQEESYGFDLVTLADFAEFAVSRGASEDVLFAVNSYIQHRQALEMEETLENIMQILPPQGHRATNADQTLLDIRLLISGE